MKTFSAFATPSWRSRKLRNQSSFPTRRLVIGRSRWKRPLRLAVDLSAERRKQFKNLYENTNEQPLANVIDRVAKSLGDGPHLDFNVFMEAVTGDTKKHRVKLTAKRKKILQTRLAQRDENAKPVIKKAHKQGKAELDPIRGRFGKTEGDGAIVEYEPDSELRDTEQVSLLEEGGIEAFIRREVLPHASDAWFDEDSIKIGYEINFNRYFYKPQPLRALQEIRADILALEKETEGLLTEIVGQGASE